MSKPTPIDVEIELDSNRYIVSETDEKGRITFANIMEEIHRFY